THDLPNGLAVRLEAPEDWRVKQIAFREGLTDTEARLRVRAREQEREYLRKIYEARFPRKPAFNLVYDCSVFPLSTIAQHVVQALKLLKII
ncbi:MAG TPA: cytidylate kinase family protein, partial [Candidatus Sumerlaeota bacterium]|nr:cytidylate kinase family protein [Candidatus Sumerlaeota bacterium]